MTRDNPADKTLQQFLDDLASANAVPGGGAASAFAGALAASLLTMVCRLTIGKKGYEAVEAEMRDYLTRLEPLRQQFADLMQKDSDAFSGVMRAFQLPKETTAQKAARTQSIQDAYKSATEIPLRVAELANELGAIAQAVVARGNQNAASDAGVGALFAKVALRGAVQNVGINLNAIKDEAYVNARRARAERLLARANDAR